MARLPLSELDHPDHRVPPPRLRAFRQSVGQPCETREQSLTWIERPFQTLTKVPGRLPAQTPERHDDDDEEDEDEEEEEEIAPVQ